MTPTPDIAVVKPAEPVAPPEPQIDMDEVLREEAADLKKRADEAAAKNRLNEYAALGLDDTQSNFDLIKEFVKVEAKSYWSWQIVDVAIQRLGSRGTNQLAWRKIEQPAAAPVEPKPEPTEQLESWQLPIDADERMMKKADVRVLKDLNLRRRKLTNQMVVGKNHRWFGTRL